MSDDQDPPTTETPEEVSEETTDKVVEQEASGEPDIDLSAWGLSAESLEEGHQTIHRETKSFTDIISSGLSHYERLPMLEVVFDRMVRLLSTSLRTFTFEVVEVKLESVQSTRFNDYMKNASIPSIFSVFQSRDWGNQGMILLDNDLIYVMIDLLLGGRKGVAPIRTDDRTFTTIECNLLSRLTDVLLYDLEIAFKPVAHVKFEKDRIETNHLFANITKASNAVIVARVQVEVNERSGYFEIIIPYAMVEPIRTALLQNFTGDTSGEDNLWGEHMTTQLLDTEIEVFAHIESMEYPLHDVLKWGVGTNILLDTQPENPVLVSCGDYPLFWGKMGQKASNIAIKIESELPNRESFDGLNH